MNVSTRSRNLGLLAALAALLGAPLAGQADGPTVVTFNDVLMQIRDGNCNLANPMAGMITPATPADALIYDANACDPVLAPDGHHLTLGEWKAAAGRARIQCINGGTQANVHFTGLIPRGVYTVWLFIFADGHPPTPFTAVGALGNSDPDDPIRNVFRASAAGEGQLTLTNAAGVLSANGGPINNCWLDTYPEVHLALVYHIDGQTYGPVPGPMRSWAAQQVHIFRLQ